METISYPEVVQGDSTTPVTSTHLPKKSRFRQTLNYDVQTEKEMIVHVYDVEVEEKADKKITESMCFNEPFNALW